MDRGRRRIGAFHAQDAAGLRDHPAKGPRRLRGGQGTGKGADPRRYKGHDKEQWEKLQSLPNLLYTDGNSFSLWQDGELVGSVVELQGDIETSGAKLAASPELLARFDNFLRWEPIPPKSAAELARVSARLCRLLRDEVTEQLAERSPALTALAADWRKLLFPEANDQQFADAADATRSARSRLGSSQ